MNDILTRLESVLQDRKSHNPESSYVASLYHKGSNRILEKIGEEATEVILAAKDTENDPDPLVKETADLWFHILVMLAHYDVPVSAVMAELDQRFGLSGIEEKASRKTS